MVPYHERKTRQSKDDCQVDAPQKRGRRQV